MSWSIIWIEPNGTQIDLSNPPYVTSRWASLKGASAPPYRAITERVPMRDGSVLRYIDMEDTEIDLTVIVRGDDEADLWNRLAGLSPSFNPRDGAGKLQITPPHGVTRELSCIPISGFRLNESTLNPTVVDAELTFLATNPYWESLEETVLTFALDNPPQWFPILPLQLGGDTIVSVFTLENTGDNPVYPTWKITGPGDNPTITNQTTGEYLALTNNGGVTLTDEQFITIDTQARTILRNDGTNLLPRLDWGSSFFAIPVGSSSYEIEMVNATTASSIEVRYRTSFAGVV